MKLKTKFKQTEIGMIPEDWEVKTINEIGRVVTGKTPPTKNKEYYGSDYLFVRIPDMNKSAYVKETQTKLSSQGAKYLERLKLPKDSIMVSCIATIGNVGLALDNSFTNQQINSIIPDVAKMNPRYIYYFFKNNRIYLESKGGGGSVYTNISKNKFENLIIAMPSLLKQSAIAKILSDLDSKIELNQQMNKTLEAIGQAIFKHWFIDFEFPNEKGNPYKSSGGEMVDSELGKIPKAWKVSKVGKEFETILGGTPSTTNKSYWENGTIPWINSGAINDFPIINASQHITEAGLNNSATQLMPKKTVVLPFVISYLFSSLAEVCC